MEIINDDAYKFLVENQFKYDLIFVDLPDPNNEALNKLYTNVFYRLCKASLTDSGMLTVQSTSPYYASDTFWCINKTIMSEGFHVKPYHLEVPSFGDWGFNLASLQPIDSTFDVIDDTKFLSSDKVPSLFVFGKDEKPKQEICVNSLSKPILINYYMAAEKKLY